MCNNMRRDMSVPPVIPMPTKYDLDPKLRASKDIEVTVYQTEDQSEWAIILIEIPDGDIGTWTDERGGILATSMHGLLNKPHPLSTDSCELAFYGKDIIYNDKVYNNEWGETDGKLIRNKFGDLYISMDQETRDAIAELAGELVPSYFDFIRNQISRYVEE